MNDVESIQINGNVVANGENTVEQNISSLLQGRNDETNTVCFSITTI